MPLTLVTWNLKGSKGLDTRGVVDHLIASAADVVVLQEVQCRQARAIARGLRAMTCDWAFKHWPVRTWPEGMAVIGVGRAAPATARAISHRWALWSWRRRILQVATVGLDPRQGDITLVNVHLSPHDQAAVRMVEADVMLRVVAESGRPAVVAGDFNDRPGAEIHRRLAAGGLRDAWARYIRSERPGPPGARMRAPPTGGGGCRGRPGRRNGGSTTCWCRPASNPCASACPATAIPASSRSPPSPTICRSRRP